jgi:deoxyribodipyrimidine photo-lyase
VLPAPKLTLAKGPGLESALETLDLLPKPANWTHGWDKLRMPGEAGAAKRLADFLTDDLRGYAELRDRPDMPNTSRLSAHIHFGEISPRQVLSAVGLAAHAEPRLGKDAAKFAAEIGWREFAHHLLYHFPDLPNRNWRAEFDAYPWRSAPDDLSAWQRGQTGYPLVDAGMRELWQTGTMHNRVRMVAASFLTKHLRIDWRLGEAWFWDTLLDADLANNVAGWQWVAGSGADAAPYFRIFNPVTQSERFDPDGAYLRRWCPELATLPNRAIHAPFRAAPDVLLRAGVDLGKTYPHPIIDHSEARTAALAGYETVKDAQRGPRVRDQARDT